MADSSNRFYVEPVNPLQALLAGQKGYDTGRGYATQRAQAEARQFAQEALMKGDTQGALARLIGSGDYQSANVLSNYQNAANSVYGTPIWGTGPDNKPAIGTFDKRGQFRQIQTPGFTPTPGVKTIDSPQGTYVVDSKSGAPVSGASAPAGGPPQPQQGAPSFYPNDNRGKARDSKLGTEEGEKIAGAGQAKAALDTSINSMDRLAFEANRIASDKSLGRITGFTGVFPNWPGGGAANVSAKLETLKTQVAFGVLQAMREASKTGGALGAVSDRENTMLTNALAALDRAQSEGEFKKAMRQIVEYTQGAKQRLQQAYDTDYGGLSKPPAAPQQPQAQPAQQPQQQAQPQGLSVGAVHGGYRYKGGNPNDQNSWEPAR